MGFESTPPTIDIVTVDNNLAAVITELTSANINLTKDERSKATSVGPRRLPFIQAVWTNKDDYASMKPPYENESEADAHKAISDAMELTVARSLQIIELATDIKINSEHFAFQYGLEFYAMATRAKDKNVPGADTIYDILKVFFEDMGTQPEGGQPPA